MNFREPTTIAGSQKILEMILAGTASPQAINVPNCGWIVGAWSQGQATGAVQTMHVHEHYLVSHRRTFRQPPLVFIGTTNTPASNTLNASFATMLGMVGNAAARTGRKSAYLKKYMDWQGAGVTYQATGAVDIGQVTTALNNTGSALLVRKYQYTVQAYQASDTVEQFTALARYDGGVYNFGTQGTAQDWINILLQKKAAADANESDPVFITQKIASLEQHIWRTFEPEQVTQCVDVKAMALAERAASTTLLNYWQALGVPFGIT